MSSIDGRRERELERDTRFRFRSSTFRLLCRLWATSVSGKMFRFSSAATFGRPSRRYESWSFVISRFRLARRVCRLGTSEWWPSQMPWRSRSFTSGRAESRRFTVSLATLRSSPLATVVIRSVFPTLPFFRPNHCDTWSTSGRPARRLLTESARMRWCSLLDGAWSEGASPPCRTLALTSSSCSGRSCMVSPSFWLVIRRSSVRETPWMRADMRRPPCG
mmetsp:Transcript_9188/g.21689  ORF Transcript_9188/g.21689 Transcript_9188/m.21689 type:complete len:219 (+) Transcript_9188:309-965(+)